MEGNGQLHCKVVSVSVVLPTADYIYDVRGSPFEPSFANLIITFYVTASLNLSTREIRLLRHTVIHIRWGIRL
jgi:hypothetical protein